LDPPSKVVADVHALADERVAEFRHLYADLMLATRFEATLDERGAERLVIGVMCVTDRFGWCGRTRTSRPST
jgi:hypothetical protein